MARQLASRLSAVAPSVTLAMNARALEMKARGVDVFAFGVGEPDFEPPQAVRDAAKRAIDEGCSKYTAVTGIPALKAAICEATEAMRGWRPKPENVCVSVGAKHVLFNLALALYEPGDEVVIPKPFWVSYPEQVRLVGATPVLVDTREDDGWKLAPERLEAALSPRTKAVILCSPSNPTGAAYTESETRAILDVIRRRDCWLIVDEIYAQLVYDGFRFVSAAKIAPRSARSNHRRRRRLEDLRNDRLAHRLGARPGSAHQGARHRPGTEHDERDRGGAARRGRRPEVADPGLRPRARLLPKAPRRDGKRARVDSGGALPHARGRVLRVRRLPRTLWVGMERKAARDRRGRGFLAAR